MKVLAGIAPHNHVFLAMDEVNGLTSLGCECKVVSYGRNAPNASKLNKVIVAVFKALVVVYHLHKYKPDVLYLNSRLEPAASLRDFISLRLIKALYKRKLRTVIKTHGSDLSILEKSSFFNHKVLLPFLIKNVDQWFFLSSDEKAFIKRYSPAFAAKISLIPNIIDPARCRNREDMYVKYDIPVDKFKVLFAGRIIREKGCFEVIKSIPLLPFRHRCVFLIMGDGDDLKELKALAEKLGVSDCVRFTGFIPEAESDPIYSSVDLLVFPTYFSEGFPMVLFKSVAVGLPVITTKIRAAKDFLRSPQNVLWVPEQEPEMVANAIQKIYEDTELRTGMAANNKAVGKLFLKNRVCKQIKTVFESL